MNDQLGMARGILLTAKSLHRQNPAMTLAEFIEHLQRFVDEIRTEEDATRGDCRHCGRPTVVVGGRRIHLGPTGEHSMVGCRSASFDYLDGKGWDDALKPTWKASV